MTQGYHLLRNPVEFVVSSRDSLFDHNHQGSCNRRNNCETKLSGNEAKKLYEDILNEPSSSLTYTTNKRKLNSNIATRSSKDVKLSKSLKLKHQKNKQFATSPPVTSNDYFRAAEKGDLIKLKRIVNDGSIDIDTVDQYLWTALMMAAHEGHEDVVKYLLIQGADWDDHYDGSGYDAYDIACLAGHYRIAHMLQHRKSLVKSEAKKAAIKLCQETMKREKLWCEICEIHYSATPHGNEDENEHQRSTSHQFCCKTKEEPSSTAHFYLKCDNQGYKLLQKGGWDGNSGLGPSGSGKKYPVKTVLKRDRSGLGCEMTPAKVTHFGLNDQNAVVRAKKVKHKHLAKSREMQQKSFEADFRRSFY